MIWSMSLLKLPRLASFALPPIVEGHILVSTRLCATTVALDKERHFTNMGLPMGLVFRLSSGRNLSRNEFLLRWSITQRLIRQAL
jgi:hypothetical protein